jgi:hypothetical protein
MAGAYVGYILVFSYRTFQSEELRKFYAQLNSIKVVESRKISWGKGAAFLISYNKCTPMEETTWNI